MVGRANDGDETEVLQMDEGSMNQMNRSYIYPLAVVLGYLIAIVYAFSLGGVR
jgi:hypothetical protein